MARSVAIGWLVLVACAALILPGRVLADLNGHWRYNFGFTGVTDFAQVGTSVSFVLTGGGGLTASFSGTLVGSALSVTAPPPSLNECGLAITGTVAADENSIDGTLATILPCPSPGAAPIRFDRCGCFDGNSSEGDGCDALCRVEACYSCSGDPSVCAPQPDGTPCDDLAACTTGETCTSTVCGGGSPVSPCIDMSGSWRLRYDFDSIVPDTEGHFVFTQHNTSLETGNLRGTVDPLTGVFQLTEISSSNGFCPGNHLSGQVAADGYTLSGNFTTYVMSPTQCPSFSALVTGSRCGGGTLDVGEECDDGNWTDGDGCDANCGVEPCYSCAGTPSTCSPLPNGTSCDDGEGCTTADACQDGTCGGTAQADGTACSDDDVCTLGDACLQGICTGTALDCEPCEMCDGTTPACVPRPDFTTCDDGDPCTSADVCQAGACVGSSFFCGACFSCDGVGQCVPAPRSGCLASTSPSRTSLSITDASNPEDDWLTWRFRRGEGTPLDALGDPTLSTVWALCVYDESTSPPTALVTAPAQNVGATCPDLSCWTKRQHGFSYRSTVADDAGLTRIDLRARAGGYTKAVVRGKGSFLNPPTAPLSLPLRVQLQAIDLVTNLQTCFEAEYSAPGVRVNEDGVFRAYGTGP